MYRRAKFRARIFWPTSARDAVQHRNAIWIHACAYTASQRLNTVMNMNNYTEEPIQIMLYYGTCNSHIKNTILPSVEYTILYIYVEYLQIKIWTMGQYNFYKPMMRLASIQSNSLRKTLVDDSGLTYGLAPPSSPSPPPKVVLSSS